IRAELKSSVSVPELPTIDMVPLDDVKSKVLVGVVAVGVVPVIGTINTKELVVAVSAIVIVETPVVIVILLPATKDKAPAIPFRLTTPPPLPPPAAHTAPPMPSASIT